jgi:hypothetical protein
MENLLKIFVSSIGCVYFVMHVAHALNRAADNIKNRGRHTGTPPWSHMHDRADATEDLKPVGLG